MRKQTVILTVWLALPFICLTLIMVWIFVSLDKDRLMNEPPVGAGAGDTGNANALGQLLAGRDADLVSKAVEARREQQAIDPRNWPGGVDLRIPMEYVGDEPRSFLFVIEQADQDAVEYVSVYVQPDSNGLYDLPLQHWQIVNGTFEIIRRDENNESYGFPIVFPMTIPPPDIQTSDPLRVLVRTESAGP
jgi:hypothetical protein